MITFEEAQKIIESHILLMPPVKVSLKHCLGRVLAADVLSDIDMPPFDKSAMDGYAVRRADLHKPLDVLGVIRAGDIPTEIVKEGSCFKIMTGALVPEGADTVIMVELTETMPDGRIRFTGKDTKANIAYKAEDIHRGDLVLRKDTLLRPQEIAILATVGCSEPVVYSLPRIAIMSTGDEITEPHELPTGGKIRNSNAYQLIAQVQQLGIEPDYLGIIEDTEEATYNTVKDALDKYDLLLLTGGISMGDFDFVPQVMEKAGVKLHIQTIAIRPGKPTVFGSIEKTFVFCLPGNPVSSFVVFELLARPFIRAMYGVKNQPAPIRAVMGADYHTRATDRLAWVPVSIDENQTVFPVEYHGSAHIYALCHAQGLIRIEPGTSVLRKGETIYVRPL